MGTDQSLISNEEYSLDRVQTVHPMWYLEMKDYGHSIYLYVYVLFNTILPILSLE